MMRTKKLNPKMPSEIVRTVMTQRARQIPLSDYPPDFLENASREFAALEPRDPEAAIDTLGRLFDEVGLIHRNREVARARRVSLA